MNIVLAGFNVDAEVLREAVKLGLPADRLTPEILSAAYARISRNPAPVSELRAEAREEVARARASNEQIVFGMGHASVAEHAVFNFDLMGLSRLAIEAVEAFRLCSYTEKSQRYIRLGDELALPREIVEAGLEERFRRLADLQRRAYDLLYQSILEDLLARHPELAADKASRRGLEGQAKEDARYATSLAVEGQLGLTANARSLEHLVRRLGAHPLHEVRELARRLGELARGVAPSLIRYTESAAAEPGRGPAELRSLARELLDPEAGQTLPGETGAVQLAASTGGGDAAVVAGLLHAASGSPWAACEERARALSAAEQRGVVCAALRALGPHDPPPRAFELVSLRFDVVVSASCFAQLKRHRMATLLVQPYDPGLGFTVPESVARVGLQGELQRVVAESTALHDAIAAQAGRHAAPYALTQAHRRRVLLQLNARELYHFARLRLDRHAQWDIRRLAERMLNLARRELPQTLCMACGKDEFERRRAEVFSED